MRVHELIALLTDAQKTKLIKLIPENLQTLPEFPKPGCGLHPNAIKTQLEANGHEGALNIGWLSEYLLRYPSSEVLTVAHIWAVFEYMKIKITDVSKQKITVSPTTTRYLNSITTTRRLLEPHIKDHQYDVVGADDTIEGHPDIITPQIIFEIKASANLERSWGTFMIQLFAYAALFPTRTYVSLVFPLQETVVCYNIESWQSFRASYLETLKSFLPRVSKVEPEHVVYPIGVHIHKKKPLINSLNGLPLMLPYQIMITQPRGTRTSISQAELVQMKEFITKNQVKLFIHAPYTINLARPHDDPSTLGSDGEGFHIRVLRENLMYGVQMGAKGVVVHLGNALKMGFEQARLNMYYNIHRVLPYATKECPLLLETGVGEGTEICWEQDRFVGFINAIEDERFGVCFDSCHVFSAGFELIPFVEAVAHKLKFIHANDSKTDFGSHRDLHAPIGQGKIPKDALFKFFDWAVSHDVPMVFE